MFAIPHSFSKKKIKKCFFSSFTEQIPQIMHYISEIAKNPNIKWQQCTGKLGERFAKSGLPVRLQAVGKCEGINIKVIIEPEGEGIITGYPF